MGLKVTTWNLEHARKLVGDSPSAEVVERRRRIRETLDEIGPDVICLVEGPKGEEAADAFATQVLGGKWVPVLLRGPGEPLGARDGEYATKGTQWIWFFVRPALAGACRLQPPTVWKSFTGGPTWPVYRWGEETEMRHSHYRHPQVMVMDIGSGHELELVGVHLKSKINRKQMERDAQGNMIGEYLNEALRARVALATEARNVREYVGAKFAQLANPGILMMGDCNDGPGQDYFEERYLFFDLIGNLQGEVLLAERFFNHALFDAPGHLRWTARYNDEVTGKKAKDNPLLLDHILLSQPLCRGVLPLVANEHAGLVEHEAFERANAGARSRTRTSDHRPVSCVLDDRA